MMIKPRLYAQVSTMIVSSIFLAIALFVLSGSPAAAHHVMDSQLPATFLQGLLSGLGHPIIGLDHFAAVIAIGCIAATQPRGLLLAVGFVVAMILGTAVHAGEATIPYGEILVALSVVLLGLALVRLTPAAPLIALALFALSGFFHGYALGESIVGAEPAPLYAYFLGLTVIQSLIALAATTATRRWLTLPSGAFALRLVGAGIAGFGFALVMQQLGA